MNGDYKIKSNVVMENNTETKGLRVENRATDVSGGEIVNGKIYYNTVSNKTKAVSNGLVQDVLLTEDRSTIGNKNFVINPCFEINQRGTSFTGISTNRYTSDTYFLNVGTGSTFNWNIFPLLTSDYQSIGTGVNYARWQQTNVSGVNGGIEHRIEGVRPSSGRQITISFWARATASLNPAPTELVIDLIQNFGTGGSTTVETTNNVISFNGTLNSTWRRMSITLTYPTINEGSVTIGADNYRGFRIKNRQTQAFEIDITNVQSEIGSTLTKFERPNTQQTLLECQSRFERIIRDGSNFTLLGTGFWETATQFRATLLYQTKRKTPTISASGTNHFLIDGTSDIASTNVQFAQTSVRTSRLVLTVASGGVAGDGGIATFSSNGGFIDVDADLN